MKRYEFQAVTAGKQEVIAGIGFAAILMLPILTIRLALFCSGLDKALRSNSSSLFRVGFIFVIFVTVYASFYFIRKIQEKLVKNYVVELNEANIRIFENEKEIMMGRVSNYQISNKIKGSMTDSIAIIIYTDTDRITFRLRAKKRRNGTGGFQPNPLGTSDIHDMETALALGKDIKDILESRQTRNMEFNKH